MDSWSGGKLDTDHRLPITDHRLHRPVRHAEKVVSRGVAEDGAGSGDVDLEGVIIGAADFDGGKAEFLREIPGGDAVVEAGRSRDVEGLAVRRGIAEHEPEGLHDVVDVDNVTTQRDALGVCQDRDPLLPRLDEGEDVVGDLAKAVTGLAGFTLRSREKCLRRSSPSKTHEERSTVTGTPYCTAYCCAIVSSITLEKA